MIQLCNRFVIPRIRIYRVPKGIQGTLVTARIIARMIPDGAKDFYVRQKAIQIFRAYGVRPKDRLWRGVRSVRLGAPECSLHAGYLSGGTAALRQTDVGVASRRLRRHDDPFGSNADVNGTSSQARAGGLSAQPAARLLTHLSRSKCPGAMDCDRRDGSETYGLGAAGALETRV